MYWMNRIVKTFLLVLLFTFLGFIKAEIGLCQGCTMNTTSINFGNYDVFLSTPLDAVGTITINCDRHVRTATVTLNQGLYGTFNPRKMKRSGGTDLLDYNVYNDVTRTAIFGDGSGGSSRVFVSRPGPANRDWSANISMYGRIPPSQNVSVGSYSDSLTATITP